MNIEKTGPGFQQSAVSAVVWHWCRSPASPAAGEATRALRRRAVIQALVTAVIGAAVYFLFKRRLAGGIIGGVAALVLLLGLLVPAAFQAVDGFMKKFGQAVGTGLTYLLLVPFFYLVFMPGHFLMKVLHKDPLKLKFPCGEPSLWSMRKPLKPDHFKRQF